MVKHNMEGYDLFGEQFGFDIQSFFVIYHNIYIAYFSFLLLTIIKKIFLAVFAFSDH